MPPFHKVLQESLGNPDGHSWGQTQPFSARYSGRWGAFSRQHRSGALVGQCSGRGDAGPTEETTLGKHPPEGVTSRVGRGPRFPNTEENQILC